jgi:hypothetical protein
MFYVCSRIKCTSTKRSISMVLAALSKNQLKGLVFFDNPEIALLIALDAVFPDLDREYSRKG